MDEDVITNLLEAIPHETDPDALRKIQTPPLLSDHPTEPGLVLARVYIEAWPESRAQVSLAYGRKSVVK